ncbi:MAG: GNAT family N-acetyltransferase [Gammaproteobacteria bacterium]
MTAHLLDNPIWSSLKTKHASFAMLQDGAGRYPPQVAPFAAVGSADARVLSQLEVLINGGESVYLVGVAPEFGPGWRVESASPIPQLLCSTPAIVRPGPDTVPLTEAHRSDMLALTALVFPGFFRARTVEMGRYIGIYHGRVLAAMAGERMRMDGYQEISAVCTHPEFIGRGYAQRLVALLVNAVLERGDTPFLHTHHGNARALSLYDHLGFKVRTEVMLWSVTRERSTR